MRGISATLAALGLVLCAPVAAQGNDDDYTPLNSRIKRDRQFPTDLAPRFTPGQMTKVNRDRSRAMLGQFSKCLFRRSNEDSLELLEKTDLGFVNFEQIGMTPDVASRHFGFQDCLNRVARTQNSGVYLRFWAGGLRLWLLQEAYFKAFPDSPGWVRPGMTVTARSLPLSDGNPQVLAALDLADCVVAADPYNADYFFRTSEGSEEETAALNALVPAIQPCVPAGVQLQIQPPQMRQWLGEALWHAANNNRTG